MPQLRLRPAAAVLCAALSLGLPGWVHAAEQLLSIQAEDVVGQPGQVVLPGVRMELTPDYKLISLDFEFSYDGSKLNFDEDASEVVFNSVTQSLSSFQSHLSSNGFFLKNYDVDGSSGLHFGDYSFAAFDELPVTGPFIVRLAFTVAPTVPVGEQLQISFSGEIADQGATFSGDPILAQATITTVPEPSTLALLGAGLALVGVAARRRG